MLDCGFYLIILIISEVVVDVVSWKFVFVFNLIFYDKRIGSYVYVYVMYMVCNW